MTPLVARALTTLETGVRGGRWHTLIDKVFATPTLQDAAARVLANEGAAGVDHVTTRAFGQRQDRELDQLAQRLKAGAYRPQDIRRHWIKKLGSKEMRPLGIPTVVDRVVQTALLSVIEPIFDHEFHERSYGFRHGRGLSARLGTSGDATGTGIYLCRRCRPQELF